MEKREKVNNLEKHDKLRNENSGRHWSKREKQYKTDKNIANERNLRNRKNKKQREERDEWEKTGEPGQNWTKQEKRDTITKA